MKSTDSYLVIVRRRVLLAQGVESWYNPSLRLGMQLLSVCLINDRRENKMIFSSGLVCVNSPDVA